MNIRKFAIIFILLTCFVFTINAQTEKENFCSKLKKAEPLFSDSKILIIGEVSYPQIIEQPEFPLKFSRSIAMVGGVSRKSYYKKIQVVKCSADFDSIESITFVNYRKIKTGDEKDLDLKGGEIIFVPKAKNSILNLTVLSPDLISKPN